jgi:hypothetical protein
MSACNSYLNENARIPGTIRAIDVPESGESTARGACGGSGWLVPGLAEGRA